jgi:hypothetical protein
MQQQSQLALKVLKVTAALAVWCLNGWMMMMTQ